MPKALPTDGFWHTAQKCCADLTAQNVPMNPLERKSCSADASMIVYNVEQAITKGGTGMNGYRLTEDKLAGFAEHLKGEEQGGATIEKYVRNVRFFAQWLDGAAVTKEAVAGWKAHLQEEGLAPCTVNSKLSALNSFFAYAGLEGYRVKFLHIQRKVFRDDSRDLSRQEYMRLLGAARTSGKEQLGLAMETIGATGIRVSELAYITVEAARAGRATVHLKGKIRVILIPRKLCRKLLKFAKGRGIGSGEVFVTRSGKGVSRRQVWRGMKALCREAGVEGSKVFPHNLRHMFATVYYKVCRDIVKLADVLGHSSIETTRIYLMTTGEEHSRQMNRLELVL